MRIEAEVSKDGVLTATLPERYRGKRVRIIIEDQEGRSAAQWEAICAVLDQAEGMDIARRGHQEILGEVREFRES
jgi:hypothetical protein